MNKKSGVAILSITSNSLLTILKFIVGIISGSVSILSEAIHSTIDVVASIITFFSVKMASKPPDEEHPYGHGKYENISSVIEGILILVVAIIIIIESVKNMLSQNEIEVSYLAIGLMVLSAIVNYFVSKQLYKVAKKEDSIALEGDALHLRTDVYTSIGVAIGLLLIFLTKIYIIDSIVAILVALLILRESYQLIKRAYFPLIDTKLPFEDEKIIREVLNSYSERFISYHDLKTRKSGSNRYIELHIEVDGNLRIKEGHDLCDEIESTIQEKLDNSTINIHLEPSE